MSHLCHAIGCNVEVPPGLLMCKRHWLMLPKEQRGLVWLHYRKGQEIRKDPSDQYLAAAGAAIRWVAAAEAATAARRQGELIL